MEVFCHLPPGIVPALVSEAVDAGSDILDLGCGAGRLSRALAALGHRVVAVDVCAEMLACLVGVPGVSPVEADIAGLELSRRFGGVMLASYLVNHPDAPSFLATCSRHVDARGAVLVQRYDPGWAREAAADAATVGDVTVSLDGFSLSADPCCSGRERFGAIVTYTIGDRSWAQPICALIVDDADLEQLAAAAGLEIDRWLDEHRTWARLVPSPA